MFNARISSAGKYMRVLGSMNVNTLKIFNAQEQMSTGRAINRPSDDPVGTSRILLLNRRLGETDRFLSANEYGLSSVDNAAAALQDASELYNQARTLILQGMNGSLSDDDRRLLATEAKFMRSQLLDLANRNFDNRFLFSGTATGSSPWDESTAGGRTRVTYTGTDDVVQSRVGNGLEIALTAAGSNVFAASDPTGLELSNLTGLAVGSTANEGTGYEYINIRHDATDHTDLLAAGIGVVPAAGGANDTIIGEHTLVIDGPAGTVRLAGGDTVILPPAGSPELANVVVKNANGGEVHLDFTAHAGGSFNGTVSATGSISIDGSDYQALDLTETDLELTHPTSGNIVHVDLTGVTRSGEELANFSGTVNIFDALSGLEEDLLNGNGLTSSEVLDRLNFRLSELDRNQDDLLGSLVGFGSTSEHLSKNRDRLLDIEVQLEGLRSSIQDVDFADAILRMTEAENALQLVQATGVRLIQNSLLNFIR